jgi:hypothetical protein
MPAVAVLSESGRGGSLPSACLPSADTFDNPQFPEWRKVDEAVRRPGSTRANARRLITSGRVADSLTSPSSGAAVRFG